ncbi:hypothetical protein [Leptolyngbya ohadii]|uniref:hypothetical protein n=1 Tax=Leptolyngbya ohadii TaxID=1962290 RepID=UPI000B59944C|nr:hypothetical protein [Leptolyngbya ohadii]
MPRYNPFSLQLQVSRMFEQGQSFFATTKVQDWLRQRNEDPAIYEIIFHERPAPADSGLIKAVEIELKRKDGQPIDPFLQKELNEWG